ncbi:hypothetical protein PAGU1678_33850, partial [Paraclostridium bifermentans subsp. muricolitidis]
MAFIMKLDNRYENYNWFSCIC